MTDWTRQLVSTGNPMESVAGFSRAVRVGPWISVGGTAPVCADGETIGLGDVRAQAHRCFEIIEQGLAAAGSGFDDVVRTRILLTDIDDWREVIEVRRTLFAEIRPVDTIMAVSGFVNPEWRVEIEVDAVIAGWSDSAAKV